MIKELIQKVGQRFLFTEKYKIYKNSNDNLTNSSTVTLSTSDIDDTDDIILLSDAEIEALKENNTFFVPPMKRCKLQNAILLTFIK